MLIWYMDIYGILTCINRQRLTGCLCWCTKFGRASSMGKSWKVNCRWWIFCSHVWWRKAKWCTACPTCFYCGWWCLFIGETKTIRGKTRNDTMQNLNKLATSRGETERCQGQADKPLKYVVPLESNLLGNFNPGPFGFFQGVLSKAGQPGTIFRYPQNISPVQGPWRLCTQICSILSRNHVLPPFKSDMNSSDNVPSAPQIYMAVCQNQ